MNRTVSIGVFTLSLIAVGLVMVGVGVGIGYALAFKFEIERLRSEVTSLQNTLSERETSVSNLKERIGELEDVLKACETIIGSLEFEVELLQAEVLELRSAVDITLVAVSFSRTGSTSSLLQYWIDRANETVYVMVMVITQDELADALIEAYERGVEVRVIIDDDWLYASGSDYQRILNAGVDIRGDNRAGLMHHKVMIIDGYVVVTGSYNWSWLAEESNDENIIILNSSMIAQVYLEEFNRIWEGTVRVTREGDDDEVVTLHVVINEVEQNPPGTDAGYEWVELYNPTAHPVDIGEWTISTIRGVTLVIPNGTVIYPDEYLVYSYPEQWLENEDESIILRDASGIIIDETPLLNDTRNDDWAWARYPNGIDTDSALDWVFRRSTRKSANS